MKCKNRHVLHLKGKITQKPKKHNLQRIHKSLRFSVLVSEAAAHHPRHGAEVTGRSRSQGHGSGSDGGMRAHTAETRQLRHPAHG